MGKLVTVASKKNIEVGKTFSAMVQGKAVGLFNVDGKIYAMDSECTHAGGPLCEGEITGTTVTCPWHGASFNLTNGEALSAPAFEALNCYKVVVEGDDVKIEIE